MAYSIMVWGLIILVAGSCWWAWTLWPILFVLVGLILGVIVQLSVTVRLSMDERDV